MHGIGLLLAGLALGGVRTAQRDDRRGVPEPPFDPIDEATLTAWRVWARRGDSASTAPARPAATGHTSPLGRDAMGRNSRQPGVSRA